MIEDFFRAISVNSQLSNYLKIFTFFKASSKETALLVSTLIEKIHIENIN